jgi:hypothetical protein
MQFEARAVPTVSPSAPTQSEHASLHLQFSTTVDAVESEKQPTGGAHVPKSSPAYLVNTWKGSEHFKQLVGPVGASPYPQTLHDSSHVQPLVLAAESFAFQHPRLRLKSGLDDYESHSNFEALALIGLHNSHLFLPTNEGESVVKHHINSF